MLIDFLHCFKSLVYALVRKISLFYFIFLKGVIRLAVKIKQSTSEIVLMLVLGKKKKRKLPFQIYQE